MTINQLKTSIYEFRPFTIRLTNGNYIHIPHRDFVLFLPSVAGNNIIVVSQDGGVHLIDTEHIVELSYVTT